MIHAAVVTMLVALEVLAAPRVLFADGGANASRGSGERTVVWVDGRYEVFFGSATELLYRSTLDGVTFSDPLPASGGVPADLGYSVAASGSRVGVTWGHFDGTTYSLYFREGVPSPAGSGLILGPVIQLEASAKVRGHRPALVYSAAGIPSIASIEDHTILCNGPDRFRLVLHYFQPPGDGGSYFQTFPDGGNRWLVRDLCLNWDNTASDPWSAAIAAPNDGTVVPAYNTPALGVLSTGVIDPALPPGSAIRVEPWKIVQNIQVKPLASQMASVASLSDPRAVHYVYLNSNGNIAYALQNTVDLAGVNAGATNLLVLGNGNTPFISRPVDAGGCYTTAWLEGNTVQRRVFTGSAPDAVTLGPAQTLFVSDAGPPDSLSGEVEALFAPRFTWRVGDSVYFDVASGGPDPTLVASPGILAADGASTTGLTSSAFFDACGRAIPGGALITVTTSAGTVSDVDLAPGVPEVQVAASALGTVTFTIRAPTNSATALVAAMPMQGGPSASTSVTFQVAFDGGSDAGPPDLPSDGGGSGDGGSGDRGSGDGGPGDGGPANGGPGDGGPGDGGLGDGGLGDAGLGDGGFSGPVLRCVLVLEPGAAGAQVGSEVRYRIGLQNVGSVEATDAILSLESEQLRFVEPAHGLGILWPGETASFEGSAFARGPAGVATMRAVVRQDRAVISNEALARIEVGPLSSNLGCGCGTGAGTPLVFGVAVLVCRRRRQSLSPFPGLNPNG